jgi:hypothetical protein
LKLKNRFGYTLELHFGSAELTAPSNPTEPHWIEVSLELHHKHRTSWKASFPCLELNDVQWLVLWFKDLAQLNPGFNIQAAFAEPHLRFKVMDLLERSVMLRVYLDHSFSPPWFKKRCDSVFYLDFEVSTNDLERTSQLLECFNISTQS